MDQKIAKQDLNSYLAASVSVPVCLCVGTLNAFWLSVRLLRNAFLYIRATRLCSSHDATIDKSNGCGQFECNVW